MLPDDGIRRVGPWRRAGRGALLSVVVAGAVAAVAGLAFGAPVYHDQAARREAKRLLRLVALPAGARPSAHEPKGAGVALGSAPGGPVLPHLVDRHAFFVVPGTTDSVVDWVNGHRPMGSTRSDSGSDSGPGEYVRWTSFEFGPIPGVLRLREIDVSAEQLRRGVVAVRVDAQVAPLPKLPGNGRGPGAIRVVEVGTLNGSFGFELSCDPPGGTVPHPARICATILADPALLYSFPGPDHSCPVGAPTVSLAGTWHHRRLRSTFSPCTGGQEQQAADWAEMLPSASTEAAVHTDRGIGLVRLGEAEHAVVDLLRGAGAPPAPCQSCTRTFSAGFSIGYGPGPAQPAGWTITFFHQRVGAIESNVPGLTIDGHAATQGFRRLRKTLRGWSTRACSQIHELVHSSARGATFIVYDSNFERLIVTAEAASC